MPNNTLGFSLEDVLPKWKVKVAFNLKIPLTKGQLVPNTTAMSTNYQQMLETGAHCQSPCSNESCMTDDCHF